MTQIEIQDFVASLEGVQREDNMGYLFYFVGDSHVIPFVSIAESDNEYDRLSQLDREGIFRVNIGVSKQTFDALFSDTKQKDLTDYSALDVFMPHPDYAKQFFICILNPSKKNEALTKKFITEAYTLAKDRLERVSSKTA